MKQDRHIPLRENDTAFLPFDRIPDTSTLDEVFATGVDSFQGSIVVFTPMRDQPPPHRLEVINPSCDCGTSTTTTEHGSLRVWCYIEPRNKLVLVDPLGDVNGRIPLDLLDIVMLSRNARNQSMELPTNAADPTHRET
jgi:hypothetical protein